jgi:excisionase family DNA binding protein
MDTNTSAAIGGSNLSTTEQLATRISVCSATVKRMVKRGQLSCIRLNRNSVRFEEAEIQRFLASSKRSAI